jgi:predicted O-methyltransferase YrrM
MQDWIAAAMISGDEFGSLRALSDGHRAEHGCELYPSADGPLVGVLAAIAQPRRALEVGCGLGYSALWIARGAGEHAVVETIERDREHARIAVEQASERGYGGRVEVLVGESADLLRGMEPFYDFAFFDGDPEACLTDLEHLTRLIRPDGVLVSSNLFLGRYVPGATWLSESAEYRRRILEDPRWQTAFLSNGKAVSVRQ